MGGFFSIDVDSKRVFGLDFLRAFAIICVMYGHCGILLNGTSFDWFACIPMPHGVDIFFKMSGFLIGNSFLSYLKKNNSLGGQKIRSFYARTALRILPNYYFMLLVNYILVRCLVITGDLNVLPIWRFATFTQNIVTPFWGFYWESWSLPVQWWFYIFFPLFLLVFGYFAEPKRFIPWICVIFVVFSIRYRFVVADNVVNGFTWDIWIRKTMASRVENIYIGVLAVWVMHYYREKWERYAVACFVLGIILYVVSCMIPHDVKSFWYNIVYLTLSAVAIVLWMPLFTKWKSSKTRLGGFISRVSILSYAMFLTNLCVVQIMMHSFSDLVESHRIWAYLIFWPVVLAVSYVLHIFVEKPFMKIREKIS